MLDHMSPQCATRPQWVTVHVVYQSRNCDQNVSRTPTYVSNVYLLSWDASPYYCLAISGLSKQSLIIIEPSWVGGIKSNKHISMWISLILIFANIRVISCILKWSEDQASHLNVKHRETKSAASKYYSGTQWLPQHDNYRKSIDRHGYTLYSSDSDKIYPILFIPVCVYSTKVFCSRRLEKKSERDWWALSGRPSKLDARVPMHTFLGTIGDFLLQIRMIQT